MTHHKQVKLRNGVEVDEGIAELIKFVNNFGIQTFLSCEGYDSPQENLENYNAWVVIDADQLTTFLDIVAEYPKNSSVPFWETLYARICGHEYHAPNKWTYDIHPRNLGVKQTLTGNEITEKFLGENNFHSTVGIWFPKSDIPLVVEILRRKLHAMYKPPRSK